MLAQHGFRRATSPHLLLIVTFISCRADEDGPIMGHATTRRAVPRRARNVQPSSGQRCVTDLHRHRGARAVCLIGCVYTHAHSFGHPRAPTGVPWPPRHCCKEGSGLPYREPHLRTGESQGCRWCAGVQLLQRGRERAVRKRLAEHGEPQPALHAVQVLPAGALPLSRHPPGGDLCQGARRHFPVEVPVRPCTRVKPRHQPCSVSVSLTGTCDQ